MRRLALLCAVLALGVPAASIAATPKASLPDIEDEVMCTSCNVALNVAESAQADRQRALIQRLIDEGLDKRQIKAALVEEYGKDVLALPDKDGFGLTAYAVPIGLVAVLAGALALLLPSWRRRSAAGIGATADAKLSDDDARRLDDDLGRYA
jgi:cytochrome c-type biogenesis protein CcmH